MAKRASQGAPKRIQFLNPEQARKFLKAVNGTPYEALYTTPVTTGIRPEEFYGLRWKDLDLDSCRLTVNQVLSRTRRKKGEKSARFVFGPPKTDRSRRTIDFPVFVVSVLHDHERQLLEIKALAGARWQGNGLVFPSDVGSPADERNVLRRFQKVCLDLDNGLPKLRVYDLRHTHASVLINEGVHPKRISERLGHSSIKLTMDTYGHPFAGSDRDSADKMERLFGNVRAPDEKEPARNQSRIALVPRTAS